MRTVAGDQLCQTGDRWLANLDIVMWFVLFFKEDLPASKAKDHFAQMFGIPGTSDNIWHLTKKMLVKLAKGFFAYMDVSSLAIVL